MSIFFIRLSLPNQRLQAWLSTFILEHSYVRIVWCNHDTNIRDWSGHWQRYMYYRKRSASTIKNCEKRYAIVFLPVYKIPATKPWWVSNSLCFSSIFGASIVKCVAFDTFELKWVPRLSSSVDWTQSFCLGSSLILFILLYALCPVSEY